MRRRSLHRCSPRQRSIAVPTLNRCADARCADGRCADARCADACGTDTRFADACFADARFADLALPILASPTLPVPTLAALMLTAPTLVAPTLAATTLAAPMLDAPTLAAPMLSPPIVVASVVAVPRLAAPTLAVPTLAVPTLAVPTLAVPTLAMPTLAVPTLAAPIAPRLIAPESQPWPPRLIAELQFSTPPTAGASPSPCSTAELPPDTQPVAAPISAAPISAAPVLAAIVNHAPTLADTHPLEIATPHGTRLIVLPLLRAARCPTPPCRAVFDHCGCRKALHCTVVLHTKHANNGKIGKRNVGMIPCEFTFSIVLYLPSIDFGREEHASRDCYTVGTDAL